MTLSFRTHRSAYTQIRLLLPQFKLFLKEQSDQGLFCLPCLLHLLDKLRIITAICVCPNFSFFSVMMVVEFIQILQRPSSAPVSRPQKTKETKSSVKSGQKDGQTVLTEKEKAERDKVIDNLLERTKTLIEEKQDDTSEETVEKKTIRPASAYTGISRCKDGRRVKSASVRRPTSAKTTTHRHTVSTKTPRKSSGKRRTVVIEPCIINTKTSFDDDETQEDLLCQQMEKQLVEKGVNVKAETLQRALYPPTGRTKYYRLTADLPRSNSLT